MQMEGMSLYGRYANVIAKQANKVSKIQQKAVKEIFQGSYTVCTRVWKFILKYWKHRDFGEAEKEKWRKAAESLVCSLVLLLSEEGGESLYLWVSVKFQSRMGYQLTPSSQTASPCHILSFSTAGSSPLTPPLEIGCMYPIHETAYAYDSHGVGFYGGHYGPYLASVGSEALIKNAFRIVKCAQDCVGSRHYAMQLLLILDRKFSVLLPLECEADLMDIIWQTLQTGSDSDKNLINDTGNAFLE
jgi:hypothetical protein